MEYATVNYITINRRIKFRVITSEILIINLKKNMPRIITANLFPSKGTVHNNVCTNEESTRVV